MFLARATSRVARRSIRPRDAVCSSSSLSTSFGGQTRRLRCSAAEISRRAFSTTPAAPGAPPRSGQENKTIRTMLFDGEEEVLTPEEKEEKEMLIKELKRRLSGPLADEEGNVPTGADRPTAIEVDGPSHFYANSQRYTAYTKLKHRLLTRMGYKVLHVPYFEWRKLRGAKEREEYMKAKLLEEPTEWLDPEDEKYYYSQQSARTDLVIPEELPAGGKSTAPPPPPPPPPSSSSTTHAPPPPPPPTRRAPPSHAASDAEATPSPPPKSPPPPPRKASSGGDAPPPPPPPRKQSQAAL